MRFRRAPAVFRERGNDNREVTPHKIVLLMLVLLTAVWVHNARADNKKTVCTITVNSSNEKEAFRRSLPADKYRFVELVEKGRPDWLASACHQGIRCDVLVISGHYDGRDVFYSDQPGVREFLPVDEMERAFEVSDKKLDDVVKPLITF